MDIFDIIRKTEENKGLNASEQSEMKKLENEYRALGIHSTKGYLLKKQERRGNNIVKQEIQYPQGKTTNNDIFNFIQYHPNIVSNVAFPYISSNKVIWGEEWGTEPEVTTTNVILKPKRLNTYCDIYLTLAMQKANFADVVGDILNNAITDKAIETMFSTEAATTDAPAGLFTLKAANDITEENILEAVKNVSGNKYNGTFIISASAYIYLIINHKNLFDNGKLVGFEYIVDGRVQNDYMAFVDLTKVVYADWDVIGVTIDNVTLKKDGRIRVYAEAFVDFNILDSAAIEILKVKK